MVTLMTDSDLLRPDGHILDAWFLAELAQAPLTSLRSKGGTLSEPLAVKRAESGFAVPDSGPGWMKIGDAAMAWDPLAGTGVLRAMRDGLRAAQKVAGKAHTPSTPISSQFAKYLEDRAAYYRPPSPAHPGGH